MRRADQEMMNHLIRLRLVLGQLTCFSPSSLATLAPAHTLGISRCMTQTPACCISYLLISSSSPNIFIRVSSFALINCHGPLVLTPTLTSVFLSPFTFNNILVNPFILHPPYPSITPLLFSLRPLPFPAFYPTFSTNH